MKINIGCGNRKIEGYTGVDNWSACNPDVFHDLAKFPWPFEDNSVDEVFANHIIEHLSDTIGTMKELYRICKHGATIQINVPHWASDDQVNDPTHVRAITPEMMHLFSKETCRELQAKQAANTPLALMHDIDIVPVHFDLALDEQYQHWINDPAIHKMMRTQRNIVREVKMTLKVNKESK